MKMFTSDICPECGRPYDTKQLIKEYERDKFEQQRVEEKVEQIITEVSNVDTPLGKRLNRLFERYGGKK